MHIDIFSRFLDIQNITYEKKVTKHLFSINRSKVIILHVSQVHFVDLIKTNLTKFI